MPKIKKNTISIITFLLLIIFTIILLFIIYKINNPIIYGIDDEDSLSFDYKGKEYCKSVYFVAEENLIYMGLSEIGHSDVYFIGNNESPDYIFISGDDDYGYFKANDCTIDVSGNITKILVDPACGVISNHSLSSKEEIDMIHDLTNIQGEEKEYFIENYYTQGNPFYYEYNNCPVASNNSLGGYVALVGDELVYISPKNLENAYHSSSNNSITAKGVAIKDKTLLDKILNSKLVK